MATVLLATFRCKSFRLMGVVGRFASRLAQCPLKSGGAAQAPGRSASIQQIPRPNICFAGGSKKANAAAKKAFNKAKRSNMAEKQAYAAAKNAGKRVAKKLAATYGSSTEQLVAAAAEAAFLKHFNLPSVQAKLECIPE